LNSTEQNAPFLITGLGNPGREYRGTRHNIGFILVDRLASRLGVSYSRLESKALITKAEFSGRRLILAKPQTYMNLSGQSVGALFHVNDLQYIIHAVICIFDVSQVSHKF
jgi:PTH1 family peptidyl-tRNA hydrolase